MGPKSLILLVVLLAGCAKNASDIAPSYVSPLQYGAYSCAELAEEARTVAARAAEAAGVQDANATHDKVTAGVGLVIFWPVLLMTRGDGETAAEVARLKGERDAIEEASIRKKCAISYKPAS